VASGALSLTPPAVVGAMDEAGGGLRGVAWTPLCSASLMGSTVSRQTAAAADGLPLSCATTLLFLTLEGATLARASAMMPLPGGARAGPGVLSAAPSST